MATDQLIEPEPLRGSRPTTGAVTNLLVTGMSCGNCARHVTDALQRVPGIHSALVALDAHQATVRWSATAKPDIAALIQAVEAEGYGAQLLTETGAEPGETRLAGWRLNLLVGVPVTVLLMIGEWGLGLSMTGWFQWLALGLAAAVQAVAGARFYRGAWLQLKKGSSNMDTLVALGSSTAFGYSAWALLSHFGGHLYFMESAAIITLISVGHWIESRMSVRASSALRRLLHLAPSLARRRAPDGIEQDVPVSELLVGDQVLLRPGDRVPTDGRVSEGQSVVDESMLTGESVPVEKAPGTELYAGTVNLNGKLLMRVTATGEQTALAHIIAAVQRAQNSRASIQRLGDRVSSVFVPIVVMVALAAGLWWGLAPASAKSVHRWVGQFIWFVEPPTAPVAAGFIIAAAVLIVACPCAMGLATPAAIMAGSNAAAQRGILIRDGVALEKAGKVTAVLFDKTGTLTVGKPAVVQTWLAPEAVFDGARCSGLELAASLAQHSTHPVSQAIASYRTPSHASNGRLSEWQELPGAGVQGKLQGGQAEAVLTCLGSLRWLKESGVELKPGETFIEEWSAQGATVVGLGVGGRLQALFAVKDTLKPGAAAVVQQLHAAGMKTYMVTGDNSRTASSIARQTGIQNVFAEVRPTDKAALVKKLQEAGERIAFVGDGINDAPALEQADLGIAVSRASDIAREAADMILLKSEIGAVPESLGLARATLDTIKQNLFWAFFYNAVGIPLAALGFMSPIVCAAAMGLSDSIVIGNALRLRRWRLKR